MNRISSSTGVRPPTANALRAATWLVGAYAALSTLTVVAILIFSAVAPSLVNPQAQVRSVIVAATSLLTLVFAVRAARGDERQCCWSRKDCAPVPLQVYWTSWTLSALDAPGMSRHLPLLRLTKW